MSVEMQLHPVAREPRALPSALRDWQSVQRGYGVDASNDERYRHFFVRDFQVAREHTQERFPEIALRGLDTTMRLQATRYDPLTEARRGRYPHEHATTIDENGEPVAMEMQKVIKDLAADWGGTEDELLYYGSEDATPLTIVGALEFYQEFGQWYKAQHNGEDYLEGRLVNHEGEEITRRESLFRGLEHLTDRILSPAKGFDSIGLLGYKRINPKGHNNQVWTDSPAAYMRPDGELPNYEGPVYAVELQAYAYDAYMQAIDIFGDKEPEKARIWREMADTIQRRTLELLWMPDQKFFAMGLDHDPATGDVRQIEVRSINVAELLKSRIFDSFPEGLRQHLQEYYVAQGHYDRLPDDLQEYFVGNSWRRLLGSGFMTPIGLRCRDKTQGTPITYEGYHNEDFVWIKASHNAARAGRKWGFYESASQLDVLHINYVNVTGDNVELGFVDRNNHVDYDPKEERLLDIIGETVPTNVPAESIPEATQAWTISSIIDAKFDVTRQWWLDLFQHWMKTRDGRFLRETQYGLPPKLQGVWDEALSRLHDNRPKWVRSIDKRVRAKMPDDMLLRTREEIEAAFPTDYAIRLDVREGARRREKVLEKIYDEKTAAHSF